MDYEIESLRRWMEAERERERRKRAEEEECYRKWRAFLAESVAQWILDARHEAKLLRAFRDAGRGG